MSSHSQVPGRTAIMLLGASGLQIKMFISSNHSVPLSHLPPPPSHSPLNVLQPQAPLVVRCEEGSLFAVILSLHLFPSLLLPTFITEKELDQIDPGASSPAIPTGLWQPIY